MEERSVSVFDWPFFDIITSAKFGKFFYWCNQTRLRVNKSRWYLNRSGPLTITSPGRINDGETLKLGPELCWYRRPSSQLMMWAEAWRGLLQRPMDGPFQGSTPTTTSTGKITVYLEASVASSEAVMAWIRTPTAPPGLPPSLLIALELLCGRREGPSPMHGSRCVIYLMSTFVGSDSTPNGSNRQMLSLLRQDIWEDIPSARSVEFQDKCS